MSADLPRRLGALTVAVRLLCLLSGLSLVAALGVIHQGKADPAVAPLGPVALMGFLGANLVLLVAVMTWMHAAVRNAQTIAPDDRRIGPRMALVWWVVPVFSFFQPVRVMNQTWNTSVDASPHINGPAAAPVAGWWILAAIGAFLLAGALPVLLQPEVTLLSRAVSVGLALTAWLGALACLSSCVRQIAAAQQNRSAPPADLLPA